MASVRVRRSNPTDLFPARGISMKYGTALLTVLLPVAAHATEPIQFFRDVLPVLSANCFACHGPDEHEREVSETHRT